MTIIAWGGRGSLAVLALLGWVWCAGAQAQGVLDSDGDGVLDVQDNCPLVPNTDQADRDEDGVGDVCDPDDVLDTDLDTIPDTIDNCRLVPNPGQEDADADGLGDACDPDDATDTDGDGVPDATDACPHAPGDPDNQGCPLGDRDGDGVPDDVDPCPDEPGAAGDGCPLEDFDLDGIPDSVDNCPVVPNADQTDTDGDGQGDACDADDDQDGVPDEVDPCPLDSTCPDPGNGADADGDGVGDDADRCVPTPAGEVVDSRGCSIADLCPCDNEWRSHGAYVACTSKAASKFRRTGLISKREYRSITTAAAGSQCGYKSKSKPKKPHYKKSRHKKSWYHKPKSKKRGRR